MRRGSTDPSICGLALVVGLAASIGAPGAADGQGCGPTRLKIADAVDLEATPAAAWALVGNFQDMGWDAATRSTTGSGGNVADEAVRQVSFRDGTLSRESLYKYDADAMSYSFHVDASDAANLPVQNVSATIEVVPREGGAHSTVRWRSAFYRTLRPGEPTPDVADAAARDAMVAFVRSALAGLKAKAGART